MRSALVYLVVPALLLQVLLVQCPLPGIAGGQLGLGLGLVARGRGGGLSGEAYGGAPRRSALGARLYIFLRNCTVQLCGVACTCHAAPA
jgi:hypothetical protein